MPRSTKQKEKSRELIALTISRLSYTLRRSGSWNLNPSFFQSTDEMPLDCIEFNEITRRYQYVDKEENTSISTISLMQSDKKEKESQFFPLDTIVKKRNSNDKSLSSKQTFSTYKITNCNETTDTHTLNSIHENSSSKTEEWTPLQIQWGIQLHSTIHTPIAKEFDVDGSKQVFYGKVSDALYESEIKDAYFRIIYDDGDEEDFSWEELQKYSNLYKELNEEKGEKTEMNKTQQTRSLDENNNSGVTEDDVIAQSMIVYLLYRMEKGWGNQRSFQALSIWGGKPAKEDEAEDDPFPLENLWTNEIQELIASKKLGKTTLNHFDNFDAWPDLYDCCSDDRWARRSKSFLCQVHILAEQAAIQMAMYLHKHVSEDYAILAATIIHYALQDGLDEPQLMTLLAKCLIQSARKESDNFPKIAFDHFVSAGREYEKNNQPNLSKKRRVE